MQLRLVFESQVYSFKKVYTLTVPVVVGVGKEEGRTLIGPWGYLNRKLPLLSYLGNYWPCAGGFSVVNAIGNASA